MFEELNASPDKKKQLGIRFAQSEIDFLDKACLETGCTRQEIVRKIVQKYMEVKRT